MSECASLNPVVILTAPSESADPLAALLGSFNVLHAPAIERIAPADHYAALDKSLSHLPHYDWLVFTSRFAVDVFGERMNRASLSLPDSIQLAAVGRSTAAAMKTRFHRDVAIPDDEHAEGLADKLAGAVAGKRILFPRSASGLPTLIDRLTEMGAVVDAVAAYDSRPVEPVQTIKETLAHQRGVIVMTSPMQVTAWDHLWSAVDANHWQVVAIGPTTAEALNQYGVNAHVASERHASALAQMVQSILK